jgi:multisubunit Na+/H+ antiporter MnhB subunit
MIILSGMILPGVIFLLSYLAFKETPIAKNNPRLFGIVILVVGAVVIALSVIWIPFMIEFMQYFPEVLGLSIGILISIVLAIVTTALCIYYGGIQPLLRYRAKQ